MVLVDSTEPGSATAVARSPGKEGSYDIMGRGAALLSSSARLGVGRLTGIDYGTSNMTASHLQSTLDEYMQTSASTDQAASLRDFADKPLVVLTAGIGSDAAWSAAQDDLATLSTNRVHRVIDGATHADMVVDEEAAAATTRAVLEVVSSVRSARPLVG